MNSDHMMIIVLSAVVAVLAPLCIKLAVDRNKWYNMMLLWKKDVDACTREGMSYQDGQWVNTRAVQYDSPDTCVPKLFKDGYAEGFAAARAIFDQPPEPTCQACFGSGKSAKPLIAPEPPDIPCHKCDGSGRG